MSILPGGDFEDHGKINQPFSKTGYLCEPFNFKLLTMRINGVLILFFSLIMSSCMKKETVDLIVTNAKIYTVDSTFSENESLAVADGKIVATGTQSQSGDVNATSRLSPKSGISPNPPHK